MAGRPAMPFDKKLADLICEQIATTELGLQEILIVIAEQRKDDHQGKAVPCLRTIYRWLDSNKEFSQQYARARKLQAELLHDRAQKYAREPLIGTVKRKEKGPDGEKEIETVSDNVERSKLLVQTTLKRAGQLDAKKYGDRTTLAGDPDNPIVPQASGAELIEKIMRGIMGGRKRINDGTPLSSLSPIERMGVTLSDEHESQGACIDCGHNPCSCFAETNEGA